MSKRLHRGFTLIELMIVVAIVAVLAAVGLPMYKEYTIRSKWASNISDFEGIKKAIKICLTETNDGPSCQSVGQLANYGFAGTAFPKPRFASNAGIGTPGGPYVDLWAVGTSDAGGLIYGGRCGPQADGNLVCVRYGGDNLTPRVLKDDYR